MRRRLTPASMQGKAKGKEQAREVREQKTTTRTESLFRYSPNPMEMPTASQRCSYQLLLRHTAHLRTRYAAEGGIRGQDMVKHVY
jgi:hypothetical protein